MLCEDLAGAALDVVPGPGRWLPFGAARRYDTPFRHWRLSSVLPPAMLRAVAQLTPAPARQVETRGRRETNNAIRRFFDADLQAAQPACAALAGFLQAPATIAHLQALCGAALAGCFLRIEYCQDVAGFWLEPHTDIGAKRFTMLIYLVEPPAGEQWGTDLLYADGSLAARATGAANSGVIFIPGSDTWHGFAPRQISGVRRTLIVNYVGPEWRARHELSFPGNSVG